MRRRTGKSQVSAQPVRLVKLVDENADWELCLTAMGGVFPVGFVLSAVGAFVGFVNGFPDAVLSGVLLGASAGGALLALAGVLSALAVRADRRKPAVGDRIKDFDVLDRDIEALEARRDEDPDLVDEVVRGAVAAREKLVAACVEYQRVESDLEPDQTSELSAAMRAEFTRTRKLLEEAGDGLDVQRRMSRLGGLKAAGVAELLDGAPVEQLRASLGARRDALREFEG